MRFYWAAVRCLMAPWELNRKAKGVKALEYCAVAGAYLEARGEPWTPYGAAKAYAAAKGMDHEAVWRSMAWVLKQRRLPPPAAAIRYLAKSAERMEADAMTFQFGGGRC